MEVACTPKESAIFHPSGRRPLPDWLRAALIAAIALLVCLPAMSGGFLWDDHAFILRNRIIQAPDGLRRFWLTTEAQDYFPLTTSMFWVEWRIWGAHPAGYRLVNVLLHAAAAILLWRVLRRLSVPGAWLAGLLFAVHPVTVASAAWISERKNTLSMMLYLLSLLMYLKFDEGAGDWAIGKLGDWEIGKLPRKGRLKEEPCHSRESGNPETHNENLDSPRMRGGNDITEMRNEVSSPQTPFSTAPTEPNLLISQSPNLLISASPRLRVYIASILLFLLALLSKTSIVMLPFILLLCAWWRRGRVSRKDLLRSLPFFALSLALGLLTVWWRRHNAIPGEIVRPEGLASRVAAAGWVAWFYLFKILLPVGLCAVYPRWNVPDSALAFLPLLLLLGGMAFLWTRRNRWGRAPLFAAAYFLIALLPVLGFLNMSFMQHSLVADHLQYAAMIGVTAFAAGILARPFREVFTTETQRHGERLTENFQAPGLEHPVERRRNAYSKKPNEGRSPCSPCLRGEARVAGVPARKRVGGILVAAGCAAVLGILTWNQASLYGAEERLWQDNLAKNPASWAAWNEIGNADSAAGLYRQAAQCFDKAIHLKPDCVQAYNNRGLAFDRMGQPDLAVPDYDRAIELDPGYAEAFYNRGRACAASKRIPEAIASYSRAIALYPGYAEAYNNRGAAYAASNRPTEAISDYSQAIALKPGYAEAYNNRGAACVRAGRYEQAFQDYDRAIELKPDFVLAFFNRGNANLRTGQLDPALRDYSRAIELNPNYADAYCNRASVHLRAGRFADAIRDSDRAIALKPECADAYYNRAVACYYRKEYDQAVADVAMCRKLGGRPAPAFLKDLTEALGGADRKE